MVFYADDLVPDSMIHVKRIYRNRDGDIRKNQNLVIGIQVDYTLAPEVDLDGVEDFENLETQTLCETHEFDKEWVFGGDEDRILAIVYQMLDSMEVPCYHEIVSTLTDKIVELRKHDAISALPIVEGLQVSIEVTVSSFPSENDDVDVKLAVAPASDEAVETHLETVVVGSEGYCVICMDKIRAGSDMAACRMPCSHVFHRTCGETWLRSSGICPVCRAVFPS